MKINIVSVLLLFFPLICFSQLINWVDINGLQGCTRFQEGADGRIFAMTISAIYTSDDSGMNWSQPLLNRGQLLSLATNKEKSIVHRYISNLPSRSRVEMTTDNGTSWNVIFEERLVNYTVDGFAISDSGKVFAIRRSQSSDANLLQRFNGLSWDTIGTAFHFFNTGMNRLAIDHSNNVYYICNNFQGNGLFVSTDYGNTWSRKLETKNPGILCVISNNTIVVGQSMVQSNAGIITSGGVYTSTDQGTSWNYIGLNDKTIYSLAGDRYGNIYAATSVGVYRFSNGTFQWSYFGPPSDNLSTILVTSGDAIITSGSSSAIFRTTDQGAFWSPNGPKNLDIFSLMTTPSGITFAGTLGNRVFSTSSGGSGWVQSDPGSVGDYVYALDCSDSVVYACTDEGLYSTSDNAKHWTNLTDKTFGGSVYSVVVPADGKIITATNFGIYTSIDRGATWQSSGLQNSQVFFLSLTNSDIAYAATDHDGLYSSNDEGATWTTSNLNRSDIQSIATNNAGDIFAGVYGGVFRSSDGGANWTYCQFSTSYVYSIAFDQTQNVFAGTYNGIYVSRNNGSSWTFIGLNAGAILALSLDNRQNLLAGLYHGGVQRSATSVTSVDAYPADLPNSAKLYQNYPNPFNPTTKIRFTITDSRFTTLKVYDILGQEVATLVNEVKQPGVYAINWDASASGGLPSGVYFYRLVARAIPLGQAGDFIETKKLILMK